MPVVQQKIKKKVVLMYVCRWWGQRSNKIYQIQFIKKSINVNKIKIQRNLRASRNSACAFVQVLTKPTDECSQIFDFEGFFQNRIGACQGCQVFDIRRCSEYDHRSIFRPAIRLQKSANF